MLRRWCCPAAEQACLLWRRLQLICWLMHLLLLPVSTMLLPVHMHKPQVAAANRRMCTPMHPHRAAQTNYRTARTSERQQLPPTLACAASACGAAVVLTPMGSRGPGRVSATRIGTPGASDNAASAVVAATGPL